MKDSDRVRDKRYLKHFESDDELAPLRISDFQRGYSNALRLIADALRRLDFIRLYGFG